MHASKQALKQPAYSANGREPGAMEDANHAEEPATVHGEPPLPDVLADPIVLAVMAGDGTTKGEVEILIATVRRRLANAGIAGEDPTNIRDAG